MSSIKETIKAEIERLKKLLEESTYYLDNSQQALGYSFALDDFKEFIDSLPEEKPSEDFPTSDEEMAKFLATHPEVEVPEKYKTPNWLFDKQPSEDLEEAAEKCINDALFKWSYDDEDGIEQYVHDAFIAGEEWQKEHSFKPTQEQLNALETVYLDTVYKTHGADSACRHIILNLLNQLKSI